MCGCLVVCVYLTSSSFVVVIGNNAAVKFNFIPLQEEEGRKGFKTLKAIVEQ
jgi:hypothetical protein